LWTNMHEKMHDHVLNIQVPIQVALRQQFHYLFLQMHLPDEVLAPDKIEALSTRHFLVALQNVVLEDSPALETAVSAFFAAHVGRIRDDKTLMAQSRTMYVASLERFQQALRNPRTRLTDETLAACMALTMYELSGCPGGAKNAYATHLQGAVALLQMRGPGACTSVLGHSLFLNIRYQSVRIASFR